MEMSISSRRGPPSILMLSMLARQEGEHPVRINPPSGSCLMRRELTREQKSRQAFQSINTVAEME